MKEFDKHAADLANKPTEAEAWRNALETAWLRIGSAFPGADAFIRLAECFPTHEKWLDFAHGMKNESQMKDFLKAVDASDHPPEEWISALHLVENWLKQNNRETSMEHRIGYLACCSEATSSSHPRSDLSEVANEMLTAHGLD